MPLESKFIFVRPPDEVIYWMNLYPAAEAAGYVRAPSGRSELQCFGRVKSEC